MSTEVKIGDAIFYKKALMEGMLLYSHNFRFCLGVENNIDRLEEQLSKAHTKFEHSGAVAEFEKAMQEARRANASIDDLKAVEAEHSEAVVQRRDFLETVIDVEPWKIKEDSLPANLEQALQDPNDRAKTVNLVTALVKLNIVQ